MTVNNHTSVFSGKLSYRIQTFLTGRRCNIIMRIWSPYYHWVRSSASILILSSLGLVGCSSGGDGPTPVPVTTPNPVPGQAAQQAYLKAPNAANIDRFGMAVAINGNTIVVGADGEDSGQAFINNNSTAPTDDSVSQAGAAYVYTRTGTAWSQQAYLKASNTGGSDFFGHSVAISGDTIVIGAFGEASNQTSVTNGPTASSDNSAQDAGAVYVFTRTGNTWSQEAYLKPSNADAGDRFGWSVAISGNTIVVGAYGEDSNQTSVTNGPTASLDNSAPHAGAAYVFTRNGTTWSQEAYLKAPNADAGDQFGLAVAISGNTIVVGTSQEGSNQSTITNGNTASLNNSMSQAGAAYVFTRTGNTWSQEAYLKAPNTNNGAQFGQTVSIDGNTIVVGAFGEASNQTFITNDSTASLDTSAPQAGAAYVFTRTGSTWSQQAYLKAPNADAGDQFGQTVAIMGNKIVVGANGEASLQTTITAVPGTDNLAPQAGAAYVFTRTGTTWSQQAYLKAPNADAGDQFGSALAISNDIVIGTYREASNQTFVTNGPTASPDNSFPQAGAAYVITLQ